MEPRLTRRESRYDKIEDDREPFEKSWQFREKLMMQSDEDLSSFDEISRESIPISLVLGDDDSVVVFVFGVSFEDDGTRSFTDVAEDEEVGDEGIAEFVVLWEVRWARRGEGRKGKEKMEREEEKRQYERKVEEEGRKGGMEEKERREGGEKERTTRPTTKQGNEKRKNSNSP